MSEINPIEPSEIFTPPVSAGGKPLGYTIPEGSLVSQVSSLLSNIIGVITIIAGFAFLFYFIIAATTLVTSGDDQDKITKAKTSMTQALIGILITAAAYPTIWLITKLLGIPFTDIETLFNLIKPS